MIILLSIEQIINYGSIVISILSLLVSVLVFYLTQKSSGYLEVDRQYQSLIAMAISNPKLRDLHFTKKYKSYISSDPEFYHSYCAYAYMIWNFIETIYDISKTRKMFSRIDDVWFPSIIEENKLHYSWFIDNNRLFRKEFVKFVKDKINNVVFVKGKIDDVENIYSNHYVHDFPIDEQKSKNVLIQLMKQGEYQLYLICFPNMKHINMRKLDYIGYIFSRVDENKKCVFIDYIAICDNYRNCGYGSVALQKIIKKYPRYALIFEIEKSNGVYNSVAEKRKIFYERNGASVLNRQYLFPTSDGKGLPMDLMIIQGENYKYVKKDVIEFVEETIRYIHSDYEDRLDKIIDKYIDDFPEQIIAQPYEIIEYDVILFQKNLDVLEEIEPELKRRDAQDIIQKMKSGEYRMIVVQKTVSHRPLGFCLYFDGKNSKSIFVDYLSVDEKYKKEGYGTKLFNGVAQFCDINNYFGVFFQTIRPKSNDVRLQEVLSFAKRLNAEQIFVDYHSPLENTFKNNQYALWFISFSNKTLKSTWMKKAILELILGMYGNTKDNTNMINSYINSVGDYVI